MACYALIQADFVCCVHWNELSAIPSEAELKGSLVRKTRRSYILKKSRNYTFLSKISNEPFIHWSLNMWSCIIIHVTTVYKPFFENKNDFLSQKFSVTCNCDRTTVPKSVCNNPCVTILIIHSSVESEMLLISPHNFPTLSVNTFSYESKIISYMQSSWLQIFYIVDLMRLPRKMDCRNLRAFRYRIQVPKLEHFSKSFGNHNNSDIFHSIYNFLSSCSRHHMSVYI